MRTAGLFLLAFLIPTSLFAADLININTADLATLESLPHIGAVTAQKIIDYRKANGPFTSIDGLQKVNGIGSGSNYADIAPLITVGDTSAPVAATEATSTVSAPASGSAPPYVPPPATLSVTINGANTALLNVPLRLSARAETKNGTADPSAEVSWSFGDGSYSVGREVEKVYRYTGTYLVITTASDGSAKARGELIVTVRPVSMHLAAVSGDGITIANDSGDRLDLSGWKLLSDTGTFRIPDGTIMLPEANVLFPFSVTNLPISFTPALAYPDGTIATRYEPVPVVETAAQPSAVLAGSTLVQTVEQIAAPAPVEDISISGTAHETTSGLAPAAAIDLAAAGAALTPNAAAPAGSITSLLRSPWTLGLLGVMVMAGGVFILL